MKEIGRKTELRQKGINKETIGKLCQVTHRTQKMHG